MVTTDHTLTQDPAVKRINHEPDPCSTPAVSLDHVDRTARIDDADAMETAMPQTATDLAWTQAAPMAAPVSMPMTSIAIPDFLNRNRTLGLEVDTCGLAGYAATERYGRNQESAGQRCENE